MNWGIWVIAGLLFLSVICFFFFFFKKNPSASAPRKKQKTPVSNKSQKIPATGTPIDLSVFDKICVEDGDDGKIDFEPISEDDKIMISALFSKQRPLTPELLKRNSSFRIVYTDNKGEKTVRDVIPHRIVGSILRNKDGTKEYDFYIEAFCLLRNQERSFHTNGISAAWYKGSEINLGDYLASLYRKYKK
jgi:hypothetical protein